jgi:hypothetical protein
LKESTFAWRIFDLKKRHHIRDVNRRATGRDIWLGYNSFATGGSCQYWRRARRGGVFG